MAAAVSSHQTEVLLNVSQGYESSPLSATAEVQVDDSLRVIEDSLKQDSNGPQDTAHRQSQEQSDISDDPYAVSPQAKISQAEPEPQKGRGARQSLASATKEPVLASSSKIQTAAQNLSNRSNARPSGVCSSLEALKARRNHEPNHTAAALLRKPTPTPAPKSDHSRAANALPSSGKLHRPTDGPLHEPKAASTQALAVSRPSQAGKGKKKLELAPEPEPTACASASTTKRKRSPRNDRQNHSLPAEEDEIFDIPSSPEEDKPSKRRKQSRATAAKKKDTAPSLSAPKPQSKGGRLSGEEQVASTKKKSEDDSYEPTNRRKASAPGDAGRHGVRTRMMAQRNAEHVQDSIFAPNNTFHTVSAAKRSKAKPSGLRNVVLYDADGDNDDEIVVGDQPNGFSRSKLHDRLSKVDTKAAEVTDVRGANKGKVTKKSSTTTNGPPPKVANEHHPGNSQANPIDISDQEDSSSSDEESPQRQQAPELELRLDSKPERTFKTPSVYPSSPPGISSKVQSKQTVPEAPRTTQKSTIISFDRTGPRNQGRGSEKRRVLGPLSTNHPSPRRSIYPEMAKAKLESDREKRAPSTAASAGSTKSKHPVMPGNVASDVEDALSGFLKKSKTLDVSQTRAPVTMRESYPTQRVQPTEFAYDDGFTNIDDLYEPAPEVTEPAFMGQAPPSTKVNRTMSQLEMPPPPNRPLKARALQHDPSALAEVKTRLFSDGLPHDEQTRKATPVKRPARPDSEDLPTAKRMCTALELEVAHHGDRGGTSSSKKDSLLFQSIPRGSQHAQHVQPGLIKEVSTRPTRVASYGSQKVDINGSPVPEGMAIPEFSTVLETFFDQVQEASTKAPSSAGLTGAHEEIPYDDWIPTSRQPEPESSNAERHTLPPLAYSEPVKRNAPSERASAARMTDTRTAVPFSMKHDIPVQSSARNRSITFIEQLKQVAEESKKRAMHTAQAAVPGKDIPLFIKAQMYLPGLAMHRDRRDPSPPSSPSSSDTVASNSTQTDLGVWRRALEPHQMNLFDQLVVISHRLVRNLVDTETAALDIVDDYRRQGDGLVKLLQQTHAQQRQKHADLLAERKRQLQRELSDCEKKLEVCLQSVDGNIADKENVAPMCDSVEDGLKGVMARFC